MLDLDGNRNANGKRSGITLDSASITMDAISRREVCKWTGLGSLGYWVSNRADLGSSQEETILKDLKKQALKSCDSYVRGGLLISSYHT